MKITVESTNPTVPLGVKLPSQGKYTLNANDITVVGDHERNRYTPRHT